MKILTCLAVCWSFLAVHASEELIVTYPMQPGKNEVYVVGGQSTFHADIKLGKRALHRTVWSIKKPEGSDEWSAKFSKRGQKYDATCQETLTLTGPKSHILQSDVHFFCRKPGVYVLTVKADMFDKDDVDISTAENKIIIHVLNARITPDYNRDRVIDKEDAKHSWGGGGETWYFWVNDDVDRHGVDASSEYNASFKKTRFWQKTPDNDDTKVNGTRDLVDFYPLYLDIAEVIKIFDPGTAETVANDQEGYEYFLTFYKKDGIHIGDRVGGFAFSTFYPAEWGKSLLHVDRAKEVVDSKLRLNDEKQNDELVGLKRPGHRLGRDFLDAIKRNGQGVVFVEHHKIGSVEGVSLTVYDRKEKRKLLQLRLPVKVLNVEEMYVHEDLRWVAAKYIATDPKGQRFVRRWAVGFRIA